MRITLLRRSQLALWSAGIVGLALYSPPSFSQSAGLHLKAGSQLSIPAGVPPVAPAVAQVDRLIVTPHPARGGKLGAQLANQEHGRLAAIASVPLAVERSLSGRSHLIRLAQPLTIDEARALSARLRASGEVESAEPDWLMQADTSSPSALLPNDPGYASSPGQWHYMAPALSNLGGAALPAAWDITLGSGNVTVAVLDTGYRPHVDLRAMLPGYDFVSTARMGNDGNGRDADARDPGDYVAANECGSGSVASRSSWHGTHVMGTIAALMNNGLYGTGVAPDVRLLPVRVLGKCGGYTSDIVDGMRWAAGLYVPGMARNLYPARIINLSLGSTGTCSAAFQSAINDVNAAGAIVVVATGNGGYDSVNQPSNCNGALAVTAHSVDGDNADYANIGTQTMISAPGGGCGTLAYGCIPGLSTHGPAVYSLGNTGASAPASDTYALKRGTSMAAPHVSGTIALMLSLNPSMTRSEVVSTLRASARAFPASSVCMLSANQGLCGAGMLDAQAALRSFAPMISMTSASQVVSPGAVVTLDASASSPGGVPMASYSWRAASSNPAVVTLMNANTPNASFIAPARGTYLFTLTVTDSNGASSTGSASVRINSVPVLQAVAQQSVRAGGALKLTLKATDADRDKPVFHALALPPGASLSPAGVFNWPYAVPVGSYSVSVAASDNDGSSLPLNFAISVTAASAASAASGSSGGGGAAGDECLLLAAGWLLIRRQRRAKKSDGHTLRP
jgi:serine protease